MILCQNCKAEIKGNVAQHAAHTVNRSEVRVESVERGTGRQKSRDEEIALCAADSSGNSSSEGCQPKDFAQFSSAEQNGAQWNKQPD